MKKFVLPVLMCALFLSASPINAQTVVEETPQATIQSQLVMILSAINALNSQLIIALKEEMAKQTTFFVEQIAGLKDQLNNQAPTSAVIDTTTISNQVLGGLQDMNDKARLAEFKAAWPEDAANRALPVVCKSADWHQDHIKMLFCADKGIPTE